jgi:hypothetical protein
MTRLRRAGLPCLLIAAALLAGCPLSSDKPLSDPGSASVDRALIGNWRTSDPESGEMNQLRILVFDDHVMLGLAIESDPEKVGAMRLFQTNIGSETFLNVQELGPDGSGWFFASYRFENDRLYMKIVDDELFKDRRFATSADLRTFVARNLADPRLYSTSDDTPAEMVWERVPQPSDSPAPKS